METKPIFSTSFISVLKCDILTWCSMGIDSFLQPAAHFWHFHVGLVFKELIWTKYFKKKKKDRNQGRVKVSLSVIFGFVTIFNAASQKKKKKSPRQDKCEHREDKLRARTVRPSPSYILSTSPSRAIQKIKNKIKSNYNHALTM